MKWNYKNITPQRLLIFNLLLIAIFLIKSCADEDDELFVPVSNLSEIITALPTSIPQPVSNLKSPEKVYLGKQLYWDPILSGNKDISCATCHHPENGYADAQDLSIGVNGVGQGENRVGTILAKRNAPTVINTAFNGLKIGESLDPLKAPMFWDNRMVSLENQALGPPLSEEEMRGTSIPEHEILTVIVSRLNAISGYKKAFLNAFGSEEITEEKIGQAIASFERSLIANNSDFDRYMRGDETAMTQQQINGMNAFINIGCADCHSGPMFSDYKLHILGIPDNHKRADSDKGDGTYAFRTPTLRNLTDTAPYMHNGMHQSLTAVLNFYEDLSDGGNVVLNEHVSRNQTDVLARNLQMDDDANNEIIAFLAALNDDDYDKTIPNTVLSGLKVGGN
ncbi:MAG: cytochrome-c peroxidase [Flavobacteriaceae bacterium]|nr:MAG: cytochrome-c peroxidase [Flavobacteriaceae bacterium]